MKRKVAFICFSLLCATVLAGTVVSGRAVGVHKSSVAALELPKYGPQKVVYHVMDSATLLHPNYEQMIVQIARNHLNAVEKGKLDLRMVLQGNGVDLLIAAMSDADLASKIHALKADGARIVVCKNTMTTRGLEPTELFDLALEDIVGAGIAEVAALQAQGYVYLKL